MNDERRESRFGLQADLTRRIVLALCLPMLGAGCSDLRIRKIGQVPPPPKLGEAKLVILNDGLEQAAIELAHEDDERFTFTGPVPPGRPMVLTLPPGTFRGTERFRLGDDAIRLRRGRATLKEGNCYEWLVGK